MEAGKDRRWTPSSPAQPPGTAVRTSCSLRGTLCIYALQEKFSPPSSHTAKD